MQTNLASTVVLSILLASCSAQMAPPEQGDPLTRSDWQAVRLGGVDVSTPTPVTLTFNEGRASGRSGCNYYSGSVEYGNGQIKFGNMISTKMACAGDGVMQFEQSYLQSLQSTQRYMFERNGNLVLSGGIADIRFQATPRQVRP
jgi:heat shock protein HslJ